MIVKEADVRDYPDHYLGWVIQPLNWEDSKYFVYPPDDTSKQKGFLIHGSRQEAMGFVEKRSKFS